MAVGETENAALPETGGGPRKIDLASVIVPHLDDYENLDACLAMLQEQSFPSDRTEVIVADNGSSRGLDAVRRIVGTRGRVVEVAERGAAPARNAGVRASRGEAIAFIDSDCRPDRRWLEEGLAELRSADFAGGRVDVLVQDPERMTAAEAFESVFAFQNERYVKDLNFTVSASMFVWRSVFDAVGGFENGVPEDLGLVPQGAAQGISHSFCFEVDRRTSRPPDNAAAQTQMAAADAGVVRSGSARRQGTDLRIVAPMDGPVIDRAARAGRPGLETAERNEKPNPGDRRPGADPGLSLRGCASGSYAPDR